MLAILHLLAMFVADLFKPGRQLEVENLFLRHQLNIALRRAPRRLRLRGSDRALLVWMSRLWPSLLRSARIVQPDTILRWHRAGFRAYWRWKSGCRSRKFHPRGFAPEGESGQHHMRCLPSSICLRCSLPTTATYSLFRKSDGNDHLYRACWLSKVRSRCADHRGVKAGEVLSAGRRVHIGCPFSSASAIPPLRSARSNSCAFCKPNPKIMVVQSSQKR